VNAAFFGLDLYQVAIGANILEQHLVAAALRSRISSAERPGTSTDSNVTATRSSAVKVLAEALRVPEGSKVSKAPPVKPTLRPDRGVKYAWSTAMARPSAPSTREGVSDRPAVVDIEGTFCSATREGLQSVLRHQEVPSDPPGWGSRADPHAGGCFLHSRNVHRYSRTQQGARDASSKRRTNPLHGRRAVVPHLSGVGSLEDVGPGFNVGPLDRRVLHVAFLDSSPQFVGWHVE
jgi:hypothetical protein